MIKKIKTIMEICLVFIGIFVSLMFVHIGWQNAYNAIGVGAIIEGMFGAFGGTLIFFIVLYTFILIIIHTQFPLRGGRLHARPLERMVRA